MDINKIIKEGVKGFVEKHKISTYTLRRSKLFGLSHETIRKITQVEDFQPNAATCKKVLTGLGFTYKYSTVNGFTNLNKKENGKEQV